MGLFPKGSCASRWAYKLDTDLAIKMRSSRGAGVSQVIVPNYTIIPLFPFPAFSYMLTLIGIRGITKAADGLCIVPSSIKQHFCACCQDLKLQCSVWLFSNSGLAIGAQMRNICISQSGSKGWIKVASNWIVTKF